MCRENETISDGKNDTSEAIEIESSCSVDNKQVFSTENDVQGGILHRLKAIEEKLDRNDNRGYNKQKTFEQIMEKYYDPLIIGLFAGIISGGAISGWSNLMIPPDLIGLLFIYTFIFILAGIIGRIILIVRSISKPRHP